MSEEKIVPKELVVNKNVAREALCIILGMKNDCSDADLLEAAKKYREKTQ